MCLVVRLNCELAVALTMASLFQTTRIGPFPRAIPRLANAGGYNRLVCLLSPELPFSLSIKATKSLRAELYKSTKTEPDESIDDIFHQRVVALLSRVDQADIDAGLSIICAGSLFNDRDLLELGFVRILLKH